MNVGLTAMNNKPARNLDSALPPALSGPDQSPTVLDNLKLWALIAVVLVILAYSLPLYSIVQGAGLYPAGQEASPAVIAPLLEVIA
jgi:cytochrome c oxidase subunit 1